MTTSDNTELLEYELKDKYGSTQFVYHREGHVSVKIGRYEYKTALLTENRSAIVFKGVLSSDDVELVAKLLEFLTSKK